MCLKVKSAMKNKRLVEQLHKWSTRKMSTWMNNIQTTRTNRHDPTLAECVCRTLSKLDVWQAMKQTDNLKLN